MELSKNISTYSKRFRSLLPRGTTLDPTKWELASYTTLLILALIFRFWDLDVRAYHHDESLHVYYSYIYANGGSFQHNPLMHGPLQFEATAFMFKLFGDTDYVGRVIPALIGVVVVLTPLMFRNYIGRIGAVATSVLLTISPTMLYYSRFARNDIYIVLWDILLVYAAFQFLRNKQNRYLYMAAAVIALGVATKEVFFMHLFIVASFLFIISIPDLLGWVRRRITRSQVAQRTAMLALVITLTIPAISVFVQGSLGVTLVNEDWAAGIIGAPINAKPGYTNNVLDWLSSSSGIRTPAIDQLNAPVGVQPHGSLEVGPLVLEAVDVAVIITLIFIILSVTLGLWWGGKPWAIAAGIFWIIYLALFTTFFSNMQGVASGLWQSLGYWLAQHDVRRGNQPWYYYILMLSTYEYLPLISAFSFTVWYFVRGAALKFSQQQFLLFLVYWSCLNFLFLSYSGEKMPWLTVHLALPLIFLTGFGFQQITQRLIPRANENMDDTNPTSTNSLPRQGQSGLGNMLLAKPGHFVLIGLVIVLFVLTIRTSFTASYKNIDVPREMLIYTQTSPTIPQLRDRLAMMEDPAYPGNTPILVDISDAFGWPWYWYLRRYTNVRYVDLSSTTADADGRVLFVRMGNEDKVQGIDETYQPSERYAFRQWFQEIYKKSGGPLNGQDFIDGVSDPSTLKTLWKYWLYKTPPREVGSIDGVAYFPKLK